MPEVPLRLEAPAKLNLSLAVIVYGLVLSVMNQWLRLNADVGQLVTAALGRGRAFFSKRSSYGY
jgi:hypothetical protein